MNDELSDKDLEQIHAGFGKRGGQQGSSGSGSRSSGGGGYGSGSRSGGGYGSSRARGGYGRPAQAPAVRSGGAIGG